MKGNNGLSTSTSGDGRKSTLTLYTDADFLNEKVSSSESSESMRGELEFVQRALNLQTQRCQQLVGEYTKKLQSKENQYRSEKSLRDDQLAKVLRALLLFEARLKQEQRFIVSQLDEKETLIKKQREEIQRLSNRFCKRCKNCENCTLKRNTLESSSEPNSSDQTESTSNEYDGSSSENYYEVETKKQKNKELKSVEISDEIRVFDNADDAQGNENWYASASDPEDTDQRDMYRNNPVLECMNQILMQNINDPNNSPPKTPAMERKNTPFDKKVKFIEVTNNTNDLNEKRNTLPLDYYETPIQKMPNFYETPQSIYSNDYEQILSRNGDSDCGSIKNKDITNVVLSEKLRKSKISRIPPALPPKPANLKLKTLKSDVKLNNKQSTTPSLDSEPDYCTISELNLPTSNVNVKKVSVVAEVNFHNNSSVNTNNLESTDSQIILHSPKSPKQHQNPSEQRLKRVKSEKTSPAKLLKKETESQSMHNALNIIPKLPHVSEIIIPGDKDAKETKDAKKEPKMSPTKLPKPRKSIEMGSSVSSLINSFNSKEILSEMQRITLPDSKNVEKLTKNVEKLSKNVEKLSKNVEKPSKMKHRFECLEMDRIKCPEDNFDFDLSQNFEEFKLDDCEIELFSHNPSEETREEHILPDIVVATSSSKKSEGAECANSVPHSILNLNNIVRLDNLDEREKLQNADKMMKMKTTGIGYEGGNGFEHFLECTGLSSKSILTPSAKSSETATRNRLKLSHQGKSKLLLKLHQGSALNVKYCSEPYI